MKPLDSGLRSRPACSRQARLYHPALAGTPPEEGNWNHLGGLFPTPLCGNDLSKPLDSGLRRNDDGGFQFAEGAAASNKP